MGSHLLRCSVCGYEERKFESGFSSATVGLSARYGHVRNGAICQSDAPGILADLTMTVVPGTWEPE